MNENVKEYVIEKTKDLIGAPSCCPEAREMAESWLSAVGTAEENDVTKKFISELEADIMPIDKLIDFCDSEQGISKFGENEAKGIATHAREIKSEGAQYCDCPACAACEAILNKKEKLI
ncbi:MAG: molecular chaperone Hsp90 [Suipraeoptans sp.]